MASSVGDCNTPAASSIIDTSLFLCQCIEDWQRTLPEEKCDGRLDWDEIAVLMSSRTGKAVNKGDLQTVWKFIAYGKHFDRSAPEQPITYSDDEDPYFQPFTAVKRSKIFANTYAAAGSVPNIPLEKKNNLPSSIPDVLNAKQLGKHIKMDIPQHIVKGSSGLHPSLYVSLSEMNPSSKGPVRIPRISLLSAQGNTALSTALKQAERSALTATQLQAATARSGVNAVGGQQIRSAPVTTATQKARVNTVPVNRVGAAAPTVVRSIAPAPASAMAAAQQAQLKRLAAAGLHNSTSAAPAAKKPYGLPQNTTSVGQLAMKQSSTPAVRLMGTVPVGAGMVRGVVPMNTANTSYGTLPSVPPPQPLQSLQSGQLMYTLAPVANLAALPPAAPTTTMYANGPTTVPVDLVAPAIISSVEIATNGQPVVTGTATENGASANVTSENV